MRPVRGTDAHLTDNLAELVCSNSFRSDDAANNAVGLLHEEMRRAGSLIMRAADAHKLPAGGALAVDRHGFSAAVQQTLLAHPLVELRARGGGGPAARRLGQRHRRHRPPHLAGAGRGDPHAERRGSRSPSSTPSRPSCITRASICRSPGSSRATTRAARPATAPTISTARSNKEEYDAFVAALLAGDKTEFKEWEHNTPYFNGCQPIEVIAASGPQTLRFGPMKPVGLRDPRTGHRPWAVVQLRQDNALGTLVEHRGLPDQAEARRADAAVPHHPRPAERRVRAPGRPAPQHLPQQPAPARRHAAPEGHAAAALRRPDHRLRGLCRKRRRRPADRPVRRRRASGASAERRRPRRRRWAPCSATSPAAPTPRPSSR